MAVFLTLVFGSPVQLSTDLCTYFIRFVSTLTLCSHPITMCLGFDNCAAAQCTKYMFSAEI